MKCTRCKEELINDKNIYEDWHLPICRNCRSNLMSGKDLPNLTKEEKEIMCERLYKQRIKNEVRNDES